MEYDNKLIIEYLNYWCSNTQYTDKMIETIKVIDKSIIIRILDDYVKLNNRDTKGFGLDKSGYIKWLRSKKIKKLNVQ